MARIYVAHDDHHNDTIIETFESVEDALERICRSDNGDADEVFKAMFDASEDNEEFVGEWSGCDKWVLITAEDAEDRAAEWQRIAQRIRENRTVYGD